jgi:hypothetical protein
MDRSSAGLEVHVGRKRRQKGSYHVLREKSKAFWQNIAPKRCEAGEKPGFAP